MKTLSVYLETCPKMERGTFKVTALRALPLHHTAWVSYKFPPSLLCRDKVGSSGFKKKFVFSAPNIKSAMAC